MHFFILWRQQVTLSIHSVHSMCILTVRIVLLLLLVLEVATLLQHYRIISAVLFSQDTAISVQMRHFGKFAKTVLNMSVFLNFNWLHIYQVKMVNCQGVCI
jgi:hypothetical protein